MIKLLILQTFLVLISSIGYPQCDSVYANCISDNQCRDSLFDSSYNYCMTQTGCQSFLRDYNNVVSEYFCEQNCLWNAQPYNTPLGNFQKCIQNLVDKNFCSVQIWNCQSYSDCARILNNEAVATCLNSNEQCNQDTATAEVIFGCYYNCMKNLKQTNIFDQYWTAMSICISMLDNPCSSAIQDCVNDFNGCYMYYQNVKSCVNKQCQSLFSSINTNTTEVNGCYAQCLSQNTPSTLSSAWTNMVKCFGPPPPKPDPSPSPSPDPIPTSGDINPSSDSSSTDSESSSGFIPSSNSSNSNTTTSSTDSDDSSLFAFYKVSYGLLGIIIPLVLF